jgi:hypothetical protein
MRVSGCQEFQRKSMLLMFTKKLLDIYEGFSGLLIGCAGQISSDIWTFLFSFETKPWNFYDFVARDVAVEATNRRYVIE